MNKASIDIHNSLVFDNQVVIRDGAGYVVATYQKDTKELNLGCDPADLLELLEENVFLADPVVVQVAYAAGKLQMREAIIYAADNAE